MGRGRIIGSLFGKKNSKGARDYRQYWVVNAAENWNVHKQQNLAKAMLGVSQARLFSSVVKIEWLLSPFHGHG
jgi:E3 ubiquitin-protein ligase DOA10